MYVILNERFLQSRRLYFLLFLLLSCSFPLNSRTVEKDSVSVYFKVNESEVSRNWMDNGPATDSILYLFKRYSGFPDFSMKVTGYVSPDGARDFNAWLSGKRVRDFLGWLETTSGKSLQGVRLDTLAAGVDWEGLEAHLKNGPDFPGAAEALDMLRGGRVQSLMDLNRGTTYRYMADNIFPMLRRVSVEMAYTEYAPLMGTMPLDGPVSAMERVPEPVFLVAPPVVVKEPETLYRMALKTNLLADIALMPSLEAEFMVDRQWSVAAHGAVAWWSRPSKNRFYQLATIYPEARWWFKTKSPWHGHYLGLFAGGTWYDLENGARGYKGEGGFVGISYGYMFPISKSLSIEAGVGLGYLYTQYEEYLPMPFRDGTHYVYQQTSVTNYFGPLRLKLALVWRLWDISKEGGAL